MKLLATAIFAGVMAVSTAACSKEAAKVEETKVVQVAQADTAKAEAPKSTEPVYKTVCLDVQGKDGKPVLGKDGKPRQNCTKVRVREKFEGTKIEDAKKK
jgi:cytochrome c5